MAGLTTANNVQVIMIQFTTFIATDPCDTNNGGCDHTCTNTNGAAVCSCLSGTLNADGMACDGGNISQ